MAVHNDFGRLGEQMAIDFLKDKGYQVCARNYRYLNAEIDIIAMRGNLLVIVEVKSRNKGFLEDMSATIGPKKTKLLVMAANQYVQERHLDVEVRFDIITMLKKGEKYEMEHFENAFYHF